MFEGHPGVGTQLLPRPLVSFSAQSHGPQSHSLCLCLRLRDHLSVGRAVGTFGHFVLRHTEITGTEDIFLSASDAQYPLYGV